MTGAEHYRLAEQLLKSCQVIEGDKCDAAVYPAQEDGVNAVGNGLAAAQVHATLALAAATCWDHGRAWS